MSADFQPITWRYIPEDRKLNNRSLDNLSSYELYIVFSAIIYTVAFLLQVHLHI
jgi:hypothetical protein